MNHPLVHGPVSTDLLPDCGDGSLQPDVRCSCCERCKACIRLEGSFPFYYFVSVKNVQFEICLVLHNSIFNQGKIEISHVLAVLVAKQ